MFVYMWFNASYIFMRILVYFVGFRLSSSDSSPSRWLCRQMSQFLWWSYEQQSDVLIESDGANVWTCVSELVNYGCDLCEFVNLCVWTYVNLWTYIFGLVWIRDMNVYQCVWNMYCMWYYVCLIFHFCIFYFFGKGIPTFLMLRTWVPSNLMCSPRRPTQDT
jgi:hypothetical protein